MSRARSMSSTGVPWKVIMSRLVRQLLRKTFTGSADVTHEDAEALAAALTTEADFSITDNTLEVIESAGSLVDLRARWNTLMRGLIASELVLGVAGDAE